MAGEGTSQNPNDAFTTGVGGCAEVRTGWWGGAGGVAGCDSDAEARFWSSSPATVPVPFTCPTDRGDSTDDVSF